MANWATAVVASSDGTTYGSTAKGDQVQVTMRVGPGSIRVAKGTTVLAERAGIVSDTGTARSRTVTFDDGTVWTISRIRTGCACGGR